MTFGPDQFKSFAKLDKDIFNKCIDNNSDKDLYNNKSNNSISEEKSEDIDYLNSFREKDNESDNKIDDNKNSNKSKEEENKKYELNHNKTKNEEEDIIFSLGNKNRNDINSGVQTNLKNVNHKHDNNIIEKGINIKYIKKNEKKDNNENYKTISYEKEKHIKNNSFPRVENVRKNKLKINGHKLISTIGRLRQIGGTGDIINYSKTNADRFNKTNILFYDINQNINKVKYTNYNNILKRNKKHKLNIVEVNFEEPKDFIKDEDELKTLIKKIKENRTKFLSERNNRPLEKNKSYKKNQISDSEFCYDNNSMFTPPLFNNLSNFFFFNKIINEELQNYSSFNYLNYIKNSKNKKNKKVSNMPKNTIFKKNGFYSSFID